MLAIFRGIRVLGDRRNAGRFAVSAMLFVGVFGTPRRGSADPPPTDGDEQIQAELERQFSDALTGATFVGHFTVSDKADGKELSEERYTLGDVKKLPGGKWLFEARIQYGDHDVTLPLMLPVEWAGDTPVITVDNLPVPGLGNFTARVLVYDDHYAGFWHGASPGRGAGHGGHLFGVIQRAGVKRAVPGDAPKPTNSPGE